MRWAINVPTIVAFGVGVLALFVLYHFCFHMRNSN